MLGRLMRAVAVAAVMVVLAVGAAGVSAEAVWARQVLVMAVAGDPGDGGLGDPTDGLDGDPNDASDGDPNDGEGRDFGDGDRAQGALGEPGVGDERRLLPLLEVLAGELLRFAAGVTR